MWGRPKIDLSNTGEAERERGGTFDIQQFRGYCTRSGKNGYVAIKVPK